MSDTTWLSYPEDSWRYRSDVGFHIISFEGQTISFSGSSTITQHIAQGTTFYRGSLELVFGNNTYYQLGIEYSPVPIIPITETTGSEYGLEVRNSGGTIVFNSDYFTILNLETVAVSNITVTGGTSETVTVDDIGDPTKVAAAIIPTGSGDSSGINATVSGDSLTLNNTSNFDLNFDLTVFRIG